MEWNTCITLYVGSHLPYDGKDVCILLLYGMENNFIISAIMESHNQIQANIYIKKQIEKVASKESDNF